MREALEEAAQLRQQYEGLTPEQVEAAGSFFGARLSRVATGEPLPNRYLPLTPSLSRLAIIVGVGLAPITPLLKPGPTLLRSDLPGLGVKIWTSG